MSQQINKAYVTGPAPTFTATAVKSDGEFTTINFPHDYKGRYTVIFFYPLDFTFVCPTEIISFSDRIAEFQKLNCDVLAVSVDSHYSHLAWTELPRNKGGLGKLNIPLVSDLTRQISKDYGVLLESAGHSLRGTFVIDGKGTIRQATLHDPPVGRSVDETLRVVAAYQYTDKHGEVCPSNWKPDGTSKTIKTTPKDKLEYFSTAHENGHHQHAPQH